MQRHLKVDKGDVFILKKKLQYVSMLRAPASSDVLMTSHRPPHLHLLHPELSYPVSFPSTWLK